MAKNKPKGQEDAYTRWLSIHKLSKSKNSKAQFNVIRKIQQDFMDAKTARRTNCYWYTDRSDGSEETGSGGDWNNRWELQEKMWLMWYQPPSADDFQSNVKLPETTGRIEATMHKLKQINVVWNALPNDEEDIEKAKIASTLLDYVFYTSNIGPSLVDFYKLTLIHGSGFVRWIYQKVENEYSFAKTEDLTEQEEKDVRKGKVVYGEKELRTKYEGFKMIPIPAEELYWDANGRRVYGSDYAARYVVWRRVMPYDAFVKEFKNDPNCQNVEKVQPSSVFSGAGYEDYEFFVPPEDIGGGESVEVLEYENVIDDTYAIIANDILVRNTPLPYDHKEMTFHKADTITHPKQFYGIGIADLLENIQAAGEITLNMALDKMYRSNNKKFAVAADIYGEFTDGYSRTDNQFIPISNNDGAPMSSKVAPLPDEPFDFEVFKVLDVLSMYNTMATQIDPSQMNMQMPNRTATATAVARELADAMVGSIVENIGHTMIQIGKQTWSMIQQVWGVPEVKEIIENDKKKFEKKFKTIRLEGVEIADKEGEINIKETENDYSFFEVKDDYLDTAGELDIRIAPDSLRVLSKGLEMQKAQEAYAQLMPNAVDPTDDEKVRMHPLPLYDARVLAKVMLESMDLSTDILLDKGEFDEKDIEEAREHIVRIVGGEALEGIPGRSDIHKQVEADALRHLNEQVAKMKQRLDSEMKIQIDPITGMPTQTPDPELLKSLDKLVEAQANLASHLEADNMPAEAVEEVALMNSQPPPPPAPPMPPGGAMMPPGAPPMGPGGVPMPPGMTGQNSLPNFGGSPV